VRSDFEQLLAEDFGTPLVKSNEERRYTLGLFYAPDQDDLHKEWASDSELHDGVIRYQLRGSRRLRLQHNPRQEVGTVLSVFRWPYPTEALMKSAATGTERKVMLPAGSVFAEVLWDEAAWPLVKSGRIRGYSMGGRALRVRVAKEAATVEKRAPFQSAFQALVQGRTNRLQLR
jgi:hypothetical protein